MYVSRHYPGHVCSLKMGELQDPNHLRDVIGSHIGISVNLLLVQPI
jgi:hypothetical protein